MNEVFVTITNVTKRYGEFIAVDQVNLDIRKNEVLGLLGPNGAGKTSMMLMLSTYSQPDSGEILYNGKILGNAKTNIEVKTQIGYVPQEIALYDDLNAVDNLRFWGKMYGMEKKELAERVDFILERTGLTEKSKQKVKYYSGGMKRRLNIGAALLHQPKLVIMDEPTVGIDPQSREKIFDIVEQIKNEGTAVIYITHYMEEAERLCERVAIMDQGKILAVDTVDHFVNRSDTMEKSDLESVFMQMTGHTLRD